MRSPLTMLIDPAGGTLGGLPACPTIGPGLTLGDFVRSGLGARSRPAPADERLVALRVELEREEWLVEPAAVTLEFHGEALERLRLESLDPPIPPNPLWRRREDEEVRDLRHGMWLRAAHAAPGWYPWGELVSGYNSALEASSIRLRYSIAGRPWPLAGRGSHAATRPTPREAFDAKAGTLRTGGSESGLSRFEHEVDFAGTSLGRRARVIAPGRYRVELAPGELFGDAGSLILRFKASRLRELRFFPVSDRFGTGWDDHGPEESEAIEAVLNDWWLEAAGARELNAGWGQAQVHRDRLGGSQEIRVRFA